MYNFLEEFEKRMEIVGIVESIVNRKNRNMEIEKLFKEHDFLNLVFSVLLYIMEKTLSEDSDCDINHISNFLLSILPEYYNIILDENRTEEISDYIIKNVLQNEGLPYYFTAVDYEKNIRKTISIRLIKDKVIDEDNGHRITYALTDQGYDFLFRTKEVDQEIKLTIEELKLKELIKRKNFKKAYNQSVEIIHMVRQKKNDIQNLIMQIKENIYTVDVEEYQQLINSTYNLLDEEYKLLDEIMDMALKSEDKIRKDYEESRELDDSLRKAQKEIKNININIKVILSEQRDLILSRQNLSKIYLDTIGNSFEYSLENRFDIEELVLKNMERYIEKIEDFWKLVNPLFLPNIHQNLNIRSIYEPQGMIKLEEEEVDEYIEREDLSEDHEKERVERINETYVEILDYTLRMTLNNENKISFKEIIQSIKEDSLVFEKFTEDRLIFTTILKLYDIGVLDLSKWKESEGRVVMNLSDEFNIEYCLYQIMDNYDYISKIKRVYFMKEEEILKIEMLREKEDEDNILEKVEISNFTVRVERVNE